MMVLGIMVLELAWHSGSSARVRSAYRQPLVVIARRAPHPSAPERKRQGHRQIGVHPRAGSWSERKVGGTCSSFLCAWWAARFVERICSSLGTAASNVVVPRARVSLRTHVSAECFAAFGPTRPSTPSRGTRAVYRDPLAVEQSSVMVAWCGEVVVVACSQAVERDGGVVR